MPYVLFARLITIIKDMSTLRINIALSRLRAILFIVLNFNQILKKRQETQKFRSADDDYIFKVFNEKYLFKPKFIV